MRRTTIAAAAAGLAATTLVTGGWLALGGGTADAATTVTETADELSIDGDCSLREALEAIRFAAPFDACAVPADGVVELPAGTYPVEFDLPPAGNVTLRGAGAGLTTLDCVGPGIVNGCIYGHNGAVGSLTLEGLTMQGSSAAQVRYHGTDLLTVRDAHLTGSHASGLVSPHGPVLVQRSTIDGHAANGIALDGADGRVERSRVSDNGRDGINGNSGALTIAGSAIAGNHESGVLYGVGPVAISDSTVHGNHQFGVSTTMGDVLVQDSTVARNIWDGVRTTDGQLRLVSTTMVLNRRVINVTGAGTATFDHSIVADSTITDTNCDNPAISLGHNISDDASCAFTQATDVVETDPLLAALADNGGPTLTYLPLPGSPAIDRGGLCGPDDQRGAARGQDGDGDAVAACDSGSVEVAGVPSGPGQTDRGSSGGGGTGAGLPVPPAPAARPVPGTPAFTG